MFLQLIGIIICLLAGYRLVQSIGSARQKHAAAKRRSERSLMLLDEHIAATRALRVRREQERLHWNGYRKFRVKQKVFEADNICSFYLVPHDGKQLPAFRPGQFLTFRFSLPGKIPGEARRVVRCYSLSDSPRSEQFRITVKRVPAPDDHTEPGLISSHLHDNVQAGDLLDVQAPRGDFALDPEDARPVVLIAGGIGITPLLSMMNSIHAAGSDRVVWLFYCVRNGSEHVMKQHLQQLETSREHFHIRVLYSEPHSSDIPGSDYHQDGYLGIKLIRDCLKVCNFDFYVCGPPPMMQMIVPALREWGVDDTRIHTEAFGPAALQKPDDSNTPPDDDGTDDDELTTTVQFNRTGKSLAWDGRFSSLLDFALEHGVEIESGCRSGNCGSCEVAIREGRVTAVAESSVDCEEGSCLACISIPEGSIVLDA